MTMLHFTNALLIDPEGGEHLSSLTIQGDVITALGGDTPAGATVVDAGGHCLAPGIVDWGVKIGEPGERHRESFRSAGLAAAAGGVTTIIARPDTKPAIDTPETLEFVTRRAAESVVRIRHMAALTKHRDGQEMTEIGFLLDAGAVAFTDVYNVSTNTKALARAMTYARSLGALIVGHAQEPGLSAGAAATHGKFASLYGLPSVSPMAEKIGLDRDLGLVEMTGARYHVDQITVAASLPALERAKATLDVTAGVSIHHLTLNEYDVGDYRTFFKMTPPLRSEDDRLAMVQAVADGVIDVIASFHTPADEESKRLPFEEAASGAVGLQTLLPAALRLVHGGHLTLSQLFRALSFNPARRLGLPQGRMAVGAPADLVLFDPNAPFLLDRFKLESKSKNTPFDGTRMEGKVLATWVGGQKVYGS
ncbi:dihydroorotase [Rhodobacter sp. KR11]|uniref:dihydroorotase n=1 Tax=Rhodobacter sp. KR11 TaxID=2974588 RepID=UPI0022221116|nr:dihydroorotase [Rhodobacter sp. KR11]MCW1919024.1 dihydroorotase [Rhodobacter sp. KR11]